MLLNNPADICQKLIFMMFEWSITSLFLISWLGPMAAGVTAFGLAWKSVGRHFWKSVLLGSLAVAISVWALNHIQFAAFKTVNHELIWSIDSKWCFVTSLLLAIGSLVFTVFRRLKSPIARNAEFGIPQP
jgi:hypothetical protein